MDFKTGRVRVTDKCVKGNTITWIDNSVAQGQRFRSNNIISDAQADQMTDATLKCSKFATNGSGVSFYDYDGICIYNNGYAYVRSLTTADLTAFNALIADADICYKLATPIELTLTPAQLEMLKGYNYLSGDGTITITAYVKTT